MTLIAVIEDEMILRREIVDELEDAGYEVVSAANGREGLALILGRRPALTICDITMPEMTGTQLLAELRANHADLAEMPFLFLSALTDPDEIVNAKAELGADDYLTKPVDFDILRATISARLGQVSRLIAHSAAERERIRRAFLAIVPHELRTPLNAIVGFAELIKQQIYGPISPKYQEAAEAIHGAGTRLATIINDVLSLSERDELTLQTSRIDLAELIADVVELFRSACEEKSLQIAQTVTPARIALKADARLVRHMLVHLVGNAVKFTGAGGRVAIEVFLTPEGLLLEIADTGIGIAPEDQRRILEPFDQSDASGTRHYEGLGLGLPLARKFMALHGGSLTLASSPGAGTRVCLRFPEGRAVA